MFVFFKPGDEDGRKDQKVKKKEKKKDDDQSSEKDGNYSKWNCYSINYLSITLLASLSVCLEAGIDYIFLYRAPFVYIP